MKPEPLFVIAATIMGVLGTAHLLLTFIGPRLLPRDAAVRQAMEATHPVLTRQTTYWRAWLGFNASHSIGVMLFGLVYGYLAMQQSDLLFTSWYLLILGLTVLIAYLVLAWRYWFITPLLGVGISLLCYLSALILLWRSGIG